MKEILTPVSDDQPVRKLVTKQMKCPVCEIELSINIRSENKEPMIVYTDGEV